MSRYFISNESQKVTMTDFFYSVPGLHFFPAARFEFANELIYQRFNAHCLLTHILDQ